MKLPGLFAPVTFHASPWNWETMVSVVDKLLCIQLDYPDRLLKQSYFDIFNSWHQKKFGMIARSNGSIQLVKPGFFFVNPFARYNNPAYESQAAAELTEVSNTMKGSSMKTSKTGSTRVRKTVSLKRATLDNGTQKVNDALGNPIIIGAVVLWHVEDPTKAVFNVENYTEFLSIQTDSTIRNMARLYPYDVFDDGLDDDTTAKAEQTLRGSSQEIAEKMQVELAEKVAFAGLVIEEVRITHIAYAEEIAAAMLQRQQASAIIAARAKIVDGAVSMVKMAIDKLNDEDIVELDQERKAQMVSNLLVVLCGNKDAQPIVNSGSIY